MDNSAALWQRKINSHTVVCSVNTESACKTSSAAARPSLVCAEAVQTITPHPSQVTVASTWSAQCCTGDRLLAAGYLPQQSPS